MDRFVGLLPVLGCLAMGVVMWLMMRGQHGRAPTPGPDPATQEEINRLRAEVALLRADRTSRPGPGAPV